MRVDQWEIPDRIRERVLLRDGGCVFPRCGRTARPTAHRPGCDADHVLPHARGGPTCPCNLAPLCRRHHRLKTHSAWRYHVVEPGSYHWTSPHGLTFLVDHRGTTDLSPRPTTARRTDTRADPPDQ
ncbi:MAG: HNH endonuclease signature motif containing protein [Nocardioides sp.]